MYTSVPSDPGTLSVGKYCYQFLVFPAREKCVCNIQYEKMKYRYTNVIYRHAKII